jgi:CelD/BcsL family acetyltransferase involved in cellulose biosynthesis
MTSARQPDVRQWLLSLRGDTTLFLRNLAPDQSRQLALPDGLIVERTRCPRVDLATDQVPPTFRKKLIYYRRRLTAEHVSFESIDAAHIEPRHLDMLFDLHERRWSTTAVGSSSRLRDRRALLLDLARRGTAEHGPRVVLARHADQVIGALLGFSHFGTFSYFQTGWDPAWRSRNIGTSMVAEAMDRAKGDGAETFDFLRGTSEYKYQFGATDEVDETWLLPSGVSGRLLKWKYTTGRSVARITARSPRQLRRPQSPGE